VALTAAPIDLRVDAGAYQLEHTARHVIGRVDDPDEVGAAHEARREWTDGGAGLGQVLVGPGTAPPVAAMLSLAKLGRGREGTTSEYYSEQCFWLLTRRELARPPAGAPPRAGRRISGFDACFKASKSVSLL
jgi:hypothetical protein